MNPGIFPEAISFQPAWYKKKDGTLCVIQYLCDPYITYIRSYSKNCIAIQLDPNLLFGELDQTADDFHIQVDSPRQTLFSYKSASLLENSAELSQMGYTNKSCKCLRLDCNT